MIINYKGSYFNCLKSFVRSAKITPSSDEYVRTLPHFCQFYRYLTSIFDGSEFFKNKSSDLIRLLDVRKELSRVAEGKGDDLGVSKRKDA